MREEHAQQNQDNFKVAPIISDDKLDHFKNRLISTLLGLSTYAHYEFHDKPEQHNKIKIVALIAYLCIPVLIIVPNSVINSWQLHALAVLIPTVLCPIASLITDIITDKSKQIHRYVIVSVYSYLWAVHFFISRQLLDSSLIDSGMYFTLLVLSIITVLTSSSTISFAPVRQFSASTFNYQELNVHSTLNVRFYVVLPVLVTQLGLYYSSMASIHPAIPSLQLIVSLSFLLWILGIISSLYNNILFVINNLLNCLIFGEQITHSGNNFRGQHIWWVPFIILLLNILSIGANIALVLNMQAQGQPTKKIIQSQHIFLVFSSIFTCILTTIIVYFSYRCSKTKQQLIRMDVFNLTQQQSFKSNEDNVGQDQNKKRIYQGKCFINHKQILNLIATILVPVIVCLLGVLAFSQFYNSYGQGQQYNPRTFFAEKTTTWVLLLIDVTVYLIFVIFKELSRARSKLGCTIFPRIFKDFFFKLSLKITGALAIMALTLRIQDIQILAWKILSRTPVSSQPHSSLTFFITYILIPILIYRSYKRSQVFSHFFHITIIVSFSLTIINSTLYYYESVFVVLAMPNFPENPFRLLLISPFTIPKKLVHKNENIYRIAYFLVNIFTFFVYMCSLGTLQFSMLFGLPMYWCVIPSISCQSGSKREKGEKNISQIQLKQTMSDFQTTNQNFKIQRQVNRSTPQHNLYEKIVSEIPFYIFRNKRPGYYLIRISKYILLVEVIADFYGIFQTVSIIGLQTQEVTTCHAKEGQTLDRIIDYTWGNPENHQCFSCDDFIKGIIHEEHSVRRVKITAENEIQLTGIIQSAQFYVLFKKCLMKALIFYYNKFLLGNPKNQLRSQQQKQAEVLLQDLYGRVGKQKIDYIFPYQFLQKNNFIYEAKFKQSNRLNLRRKLPPIGKKDEKMKKQKIIDDFADLIGASNSDIIMKNGSVEQKKQVIDIDRVHQQSFIKQNHDNNQKTDKSSLNMAIIISAYLSVIGKINYLNPERLYKLMKKDNSVLSQFQFKAGLELVANSVGCALKIAIGKQLQAEQQVQFDDFANYDKNEYLGILESTGFSDAIQRQKQDIWTVSYNQIKKALAVKRIAKNDTALYMFSLQTHAVQAVWNNLRFQLLFATNDNDQRYSIQTHQYLLRNLLVEGCEQPYGYAGYYSEEFINL